MATTSLTLSYEELTLKFQGKRISYNDLLQADEWQNKRKIILRRDQNKCVKCQASSTGSKPVCLQVHHTY
jgi:5-methylcytosine-specific restriction endonuclease McrA